MTGQAGALRVEPVRGSRDRSAFRWLPFRLYRGDPCWVPPLHRDVRAFLRPERHPFAGSGTLLPFLAWRGDRVVGRIAAVENRAHNDYHRRL